MNCGPTGVAGRRKTVAAGILLLCTGIALASAGCTVSPENVDRELTNVVSWTTASESDIFGFDVYRSDTRGGSFVRITAQPVAGGGTTDVPRDYRFVDDDIDAGQVYFYYVESISLSGERKRFTPVMRAAPKGASGR